MTVIDHTIGYELVDSGEIDSEQWAIRITTGEFADTVFKFGSIVPHENGDELSISFSYDVFEPAEPYVDEKLDRFHDAISEILNDILQQQIEKEVANGTDRISDTEESDSQSTVYEEGIPIS